MEISALKIAVIGAGNMGGAIVRGLSAGSLVNPSDISVSDVNEKSLAALKSAIPEIRISAENREIIPDADLILLAVKPWLVSVVADEIREMIDYRKQLIVSIAAGVNLDTLQSLFSPEAALIRIIPNTAIEVLQSVSTISVRNVSAGQESLVVSIFSELGKVFVVPETQMNAFMALSSCGIAYAFRYIRAAMEGGVEMGIYPHVAKEVVVQTLRGAIEMIEKNDSHPEMEIDKVTTPGGITIRGLNEMEANGFTNAVIKGLKASHIK